MSEITESKKVLLIDDDPVTIKMTEDKLQDHGFEVVTATEAASGLELAMKSKPQVIILDVMMPVINGYNICRLLKNEKDFKHIPIILLTSRSEDEDIKIGHEVGADAYIVKPFKFEELMQKIEAVLQSAGCFNATDNLASD